MSSDSTISLEEKGPVDGLRKKGQLQNMDGGSDAIGALVQKCKNRDRCYNKEGNEGELN